LNGAAQSSGNQAQPQSAGPENMKLAKTRSEIMRAIKSMNTSPELYVRRLLHKNGYRYRLHCRDLPGRPDIVFPSRKKIIFIHGCFWHGHKCARGDRLPKTNREYWRKKISRNNQRDIEHIEALKQEGWRVLVIWECELKKEKLLLDRLAEFLES